MSWKKLMHQDHLACIVLDRAGPTWDQRARGDPGRRYPITASATGAPAMTLLPGRLSTAIGAPVRSIISKRSTRSSGGVDTNSSPVRKPSTGLLLRWRRASDQIDLEP